MLIYTCSYHSNPIPYPPKTEVMDGRKNRVSIYDISYNLKEKDPKYDPEGTVFILILTIIFADHYIRFHRLL